MKWIAICTALLASFSAHAQQAGDDYDVIFAPSPQAQRAQQGVMVGLNRYLDQTVVVGAFGTILTKQGEQDWQQAEVPTSVLLTSAHYIDANTIWVSGHDGVLLRSQDAGASWQRMLDGFQLLNKELEWLQEREATLLTRIEDAEDDDEAAEYEFLLDELSFQVQAAEIQQDVGPTKPLF
ncbi:MAG: hypothetical protein M1363_03190, partial [Gammaproteobacteria bacterium]|nr:hypothetical protein [Gammaproteobacteria bacterium]